MRFCRLKAMIVWKRLRMFEKNNSPITDSRKQNCLMFEKRLGASRHERVYLKGKKMAACFPPGD